MDVTCWKEVCLLLRLSKDKGQACHPIKDIIIIILYNIYNILSFYYIIYNILLYNIYIIYYIPEWY